MFQYDEKGVENMLLRIAVCDDEAIHRLIIRDKLDAYAISNDSLPMHTAQKRL